MLRYRIPAALIVLVIWTALTLLLPPSNRGGNSALVDLVAHGVGWSFLVASIFGVGTVAVLRWRDTGLTVLPAPGTWPLCWPPLLYGVTALGVGVVLGLPPAQMILWIGVNTALVGLSEEVMFRGILWSAFRRAMPFWPAVLLVSVLFGAVHSLNALVTGNLAQALVQSGLAFLTGLMFLALRLRTGSLWPPILLHGFWDFSTFMMSGSARPPADPAWLDMLALAPLGLVVVNWIAAVWLLRRYRG